MGPTRCDSSIGDEHKSAWLRIEQTPNSKPQPSVLHRHRLDVAACSIIHISGLEAGLDILRKQIAKGAGLKPVTLLVEDLDMQEPPQLLVETVQRIIR